MSFPSSFSSLLTSSLADNIMSTFEPPDSSFAADKYNYVITDMTGSSFLNHLEERMREWQSLYDMWIKKLRSSSKPCTDVSVISGLHMQDLELRKVSAQANITASDSSLFAIECR